MNQRIYTVVDDGCPKCGTYSLRVGYFATRAEAESAVKVVGRLRGGWRKDKPACGHVHALRVETMDCENETVGRVDPRVRPAVDPQAAFARVR